MAPDAAGVGGATGQANGDARGGGVVSENTRRSIQIVGDDVQIAVVVEIGEGHALGDADRVKAPGGRPILEGEIAAVVKENVREMQTGKLTEHADQLAERDTTGGDLGFDPAAEIEVLEVAEHAVGHQNVLVTVQIHIEQHRVPGPLRSLQAGVVSDLGKGAVAPVELERVLEMQWPVVNQPDRAKDRRHAGNLDLPVARLAADHVDDVKIHVAVPVQIAEVHPHGKVGGVAEGQPRQGPEPALAVIDPSAVGRMKIVAHVNVRGTVSGEIVEPHAEPPVAKRLLQGSSVFIEKGAIGKGQRGEPPAAIVEVETIRFAVLDDFPAETQIETVGKVRSRGRPAVHLDDDRAIVDHLDFEPGGRAVANGGGTIVHHVEIQIAVAVDVRQGHRHAGGGAGHAAGFGDLPEPATAIVLENPGALPQGSHQQIQIAVAIEVGKCRARRVLSWTSQHGLIGDFLEPEVA